MSVTQTSAGGAAGAGVRQSQRPRNDQNGGELHAVIMELLPSLPPNAGEMPIGELLDVLKTKAAGAFEAVDRLAATAQQRSRVSDAEAAMWREKGNAEFNTGALEESLVSYTHGIFAAQGDEAMATLLNNRSTVFYKRRRFADACLDAHRAVQLKRDYGKALLRRGHALVELGFPDAGKKDIAAAEREAFADGNSDADVAALFDGLGAGQADMALPPRAALRSPVVVERTARGRGLVAKERLDGGSVVLEETPFALTARAEAQLSVCSYCMHVTSCLYPGEPYRAHGTKGGGLFCSDACARAAWSYYGAAESTNAFFFCCPNDARLAWRMVQGETQFPAVERVDGGCFDESFDPLSPGGLGAAHVRTLEGSFSKELVPAAVVGGYESIVACLALYMGAAATPLLAERLRKAQRQVLLNAFDVTVSLRVSTPGGGGSEGDGGAAAAAASGLVTVNATERVGKALYAIGALFNHACDPNCFASFMHNPQGSSPKLVVKTIRPVMEGEELTLAYGGIDVLHFHSLANRLQTLRERFGFICRCTSCAHQVDEPVRGSNREHYVKAADYYQKGRRMIRERQYATAVTVLLQSYEMVMKFICPPPNPPQLMVPKTHDALALAYFHLGDRARCVDHLKAALRTDVEVHRGNTNRVGLINEYTRLAFVVTDTDERRQYAEKAIELLRRFYAASPMLELEVAYVESSYKRGGTGRESS